MTGPPRLAGIFRYPVKGMSAEALSEVELQRLGALPLDRRFALALADSPFDPQPVWLRKTHFLMLMRDEQLATLDVTYCDGEGRIEVSRAGQKLVEADIETSEGREELECFFAAELDLPAPPRLVEAAGHVFTDDPEKLVSLLNLETVRAIETTLGRPVEAARFRANLHIEGLEAWSELDWVGHELSIGAARFEVVKRIDRCAATNVEPGTGQRDLNLPGELRRHFGHIYCGVLLRVIGGGTVRAGDPLRSRWVEDPGQPASASQSSIVPGRGRGS